MPSSGTGHLETCSFGHDGYTVIITITKTQQIALWIGAALMMVTVANADSLEFARKSLGLEIKTELFGAPLANFSGAQMLNVGGPRLNSDGGIVWYRTDEALVYERDHPGRVLRFGFQSGYLAAVRVYSGSPFDPDKQKVARIKESLSSVFAAFKQIAGQSLVYQDEHLRVRYEPFCSPEENIFAVILFTPPTKE